MCGINDGGEFGCTNLGIYPKEPELKPEYRSTHASFLKVDINLVVGDSYPFFILWMPHVRQQLSVKHLDSSFNSVFFKFSAKVL